MKAYARFATPLRAAYLAIAIALVAVTAAPAFAKNDDGNCNGNCQADPAPAPMLGGSLIGLAVLGAGSFVLYRRKRRD
ncbi:MAG TPA: MYXO-CTERM sorting domain-containing protein [Aliidongia sp.]|nr:MYXO-CTERM sorting domain-containing protein [Aliidongia sp.]